MGTEPIRYIVMHGSCDGLEATMAIDDAKSASAAARQINAEDIETIYSVHAYDHADRTMKDVTEEIAYELTMNSYKDGEVPSFASIDLIDSYKYPYFGHYESRRNCATSADDRVDYRRMAAE